MPTYKQTELQIHSVQSYSHIQSLLMQRHNKSENRLSLKPSCLTSCVGLIGSSLGSIEMCACLPYTKESSHSEPKSSSLWEYERKTRGRGSEADMKTTMWSWFTSEEVQTLHQGCDHKKTNNSNNNNKTILCICARVNKEVFILRCNLLVKRWKCLMWLLLLSFSKSIFWLNDLEEVI